MKNLFTKFKENWLRLFVIALFFAFVGLVLSGNFARLYISLRVLFNNFTYGIVKIWNKDVEPPLQPLDELILYHGGTLKYILPIDFNTFIDRLKLTFNLAINETLLMIYGYRVVSSIDKYAKLFVLGYQFFIIWYIWNYFMMKKYHANSLPEDSAQLKSWKSFSKKRIDPIRKVFKSSIKYLFAKKWFKTAMIIIILFAISGISIPIDILSTYFYFISSWDVLAIYKLTVVILVDLVPFFLNTRPALQVMIFYYIFSKIRREMALRKNEKHEEKNKDLVRQLPNYVFLDGASRAGKDAIGTDMAMTALDIMRSETLLGLIKDIEKRFIHFNWNKVDVFVDEKRKDGGFKNENDISEYCLELSIAFEKTKDADKYLFGYDYKKYGLNYYDELINESIFDALTDYMWAYFLYNEPLALAIGNYPISFSRGVDTTKPCYVYNYTNDYFRQGLKDIENRVLSACVNYNHMRLGKKTSEIEQEYVPSVGVYTFSEFEKERGSNDQNKSLKRGSDFANQLNDLFNERWSIWSHSAELRHKMLLKVFINAQQSINLNPQLRKLFESIMSIDRRKVKEKNTLRLFKLEKMILDAIVDFRDKYHYKKKQNRRDNTLRTYFSNCIIKPINDYSIRMNNLFGFKEYLLGEKNGSIEDSSTNELKYYLHFKKAYAGRYSSTCMDELFKGAMKRQKNKASIFDLPRFKNIKQSIEEMKGTEGYFISSILDYFGLNT